MKLNAKFHNALKIMIDIVRHDRGDGVLQKDIAERNNISPKFMNSIIAPLKANNLIYRNKRYMGGYKLAINPPDVSIYSIFRAFEPELCLYPCLSCNIECQNSKSCAVNYLMSEINQNLKNFMETITLNDLIIKQELLYPIQTSE